MRANLFNPAFIGTIVIAAGLALSACASKAPAHLSDDFGAALKQDLAAQIADPDAKYTGIPAPGSDGARAALAQKRYERGAVVAPPAAAASEIGATGASTVASP